MRRYASVAILVLLGLLVIKSEFVFDTNLRTSAFIGDLFDADPGEKEDLIARIEELEKENASLREELLEQSVNPVDKIKVYSSYPFNSRSEIAIAAGEDMGIEEGDVVVYAGDILVGRVRSVFDTSSVVTTIFDPSWEMAVRVGSAEVDALMRGGNELTLSLIPQSAFVERGDSVISADRNFSYGLDLGTIGEVKNTEGDVFQEAVLESSLNLKNLKDVTVYR